MSSSAHRHERPSHKPHRPPYHDGHDDHPSDHPLDPPANPRYPDPRIYGTYASPEPPVYIPHPIDHLCFRPRKADYKPPRTCGEEPGDLCVRKDHRQLTADEQSRFLNAFTAANAAGALGPLVDIHGNAAHQAHGNPRFLPWHRIYLLRFEALLMSIDPTVCIPYWNSSDEQAFPAWLQGFAPTIQLAAGPHTVTRSIGFGATLPTAADVAAAAAQPTFSLFTSDLEGVHDSGHVWVGGSMQLFATAPADPVFWMHHAEIDRRWALWQATHPGQNPPLSGSSAILDPWPETEADTRDISALGYAYA